LKNKKRNIEWKVTTAGAKKSGHQKKLETLKKTWKKSKTVGFGPNPFPPPVIYFYNYIILLQYL